MKEDATRIWSEPDAGPAACRSLELVDVPAPFRRHHLLDLGVTGLQFGSSDGRHPLCLNSDLVGLTSGDTSTAMGRIYRVDGDSYFVGLDACLPLPFATGCVDWVYAEHLIEHLSLVRGTFWLREVRRILVPGGVLRLSTPDLRRYAEAYVRDDGFFTEHRRRLLEMGARPDLPDRRAFMMNQIFRSHGHEWIYDADELRYALGEAGFAAGDIRVCGFRQGAVPEVAQLDRAVRSDESLYVEASRAITASHSSA